MTELIPKAASGRYMSTSNVASASAEAIAVTLSGLEQDHPLTAEWAPMALDLRTIREIAGTLRDVLPLDILDDSDQEELARQMRVRRYRTGEVIYHRGDPSQDAFVVYAGLVKVLLLDEAGHEVLVALLARGEFFGELALFQEAPRESTVVAVIPTTALQLSREACWRVLDRNPKAREFAFRRLSGVIQRLSDKLEGLAFLDVPSRLAKYLLEIDLAGEGPPLTQDDLAAAISSTRVTVNKLLADFERRGLVRVERRKLKVIDRERLQREIRS